MSYADRLDKLNKGYQKAEASSGGGSRPSDGEHHMKIEKAILEECKKGKLKGQLQVTWQLVIAAGADAGKRCWKRTSLEGKNAEVGLGILKSDLTTLGFAEMKNLKSLIGKNGILEKTVGKVVLARLATARDPRWYNIYFNDLVEEMPESEDIEPAEDDTIFEDEPEEIDLEEETEKTTKKSTKKSAPEPEEDSDDEDSEESEDPSDWSLDDVDAIEL